MALAGLVAYYTDSSCSDGEPEPAATLATKSPTRRTDFFAINADDSDSDEASVPEEVVSANEPNRKSLPNPLADGPSSSLASPGLSSKTKGTVFSNKYAELERAELALLEKHVKLTEEPTCNKAPCFKFKRGLCRKGKKCPFSHDLGFQAPVKSSTSYDEEEDESGESGGSATTKRRIGVTNTLMPAKRAMKSLRSQREMTKRWDIAHQPP